MNIYNNCVSLNYVFITCILIIPVDVQITDSDEATPTAGESYSLTCDTSDVSGFTYQWTRTNGDVRPPSTEATLSFSPLRLSDAGQYTCEATLNSMTHTSNFEVIVQGESDAA